jgi:hypothetical protein
MGRIREREKYNFCLQRCAGTNYNCVYKKEKKKLSRIFYKRAKGIYCNHVINNVNYNKINGINLINVSYRLFIINRTIKICILQSC